jgi:hypothetical protein
VLRLRRSAGPAPDSATLRRHTTWPVQAS